MPSFFNLCDLLLATFFQLPKKKKKPSSAQKKIGSAPTRGGTGLTQEALAKIIISKKRCQLKYFQESWFHYWPTFYPLIKQERGKKLRVVRVNEKILEVLRTYRSVTEKKTLVIFFYTASPLPGEKDNRFLILLPHPILT